MKTILLTGALSRTSDQQISLHLMENFSPSRAASGRMFVTSFLFFSVVALITSATVYADQVGIPETSIIVSHQDSAIDTDDCGTNLTPPCRTIQHAVNRIAPSGSITVFPGVYYENILVNKTGITISSLDGRPSTIIDGGRATNETVSEAMRIIADGVTIGLPNPTPNGYDLNNSNGFVFRNSVASGLFNLGNNVTISGNTATDNGARGFQFGLSTVDDFIDSSSKNIIDDPLNGATFVGDDLNVQTQSNIIVHNNLAYNNALGGLYFSAFDDSSVFDNNSISNRGAPAFLGQGSGFWIDAGSNRVTLERNRALSNTGDGIFYRRGGGNIGGLVTDQTAIGNIARTNGRHGIIFMGDDIIAQDNSASHNQGDGFHFMGFDTVLDVSNNILTDNLGAGLGFRGLFGNPNSILLNFDANGQPIRPGGIHHNLIRNNQAHSFPAEEMGNNFSRCGIASTINNGSIIEISANNLIGDQEICDSSGSSVVQR